MLDIRKYPLVSDQIEYPELSVIMRELYSALTSHIPGDIVELGCYTGTTSLFIQRVLQAEDAARAFHVYDSFSGLPEKTTHDASPAGMQFKGGELLASKQQFIRYFKQAGLPVPRIHKKWFEELSSSDLPQTIAFAFLDGDFYTSIMASLKVITPHLSKGAVVVVDDYQSEALPGARIAVEEWTTEHHLNIRTEQSLAIIHFK